MSFHSVLLPGLHRPQLAAKAAAMVPSLHRLCYYPPFKQRIDLLSRRNHSRAINAILEELAVSAATAVRDCLPHFPEQRQEEILFIRSQCPQQLFIPAAQEIEEV